MVRLVLILLLTPVLCFAQTSGEVINGTLRVTQDAGTPTKIVGQNSSGDHHGLVVGSGLTLSNDTLSSTAVGGGIVFANIIPIKMLGLNGTKDTITDIIVDYWESPGLPTTPWRDDVYLQNDTLMAKRGSYFEGYSNTSYSKNLTAGQIDTLDNVANASPNILDWSESAGRWTHNCPGYETIAPTGYEVLKMYAVSAQVSLSVTSVTSVESSILIYVDGVVQNNCAAEFTLPSNNHEVSASVSCHLLLECDAIVDVRLANNSGDSKSFVIERVNLNAYHIKTYLNELAE